MQNSDGYVISDKDWPGKRTIWVAVTKKDLDTLYRNTDNVCIEHGDFDLVLTTAETRDTFRKVEKNKGGFEI